MRTIFLSCFLSFTMLVHAQVNGLVSGPWAGNITMRTAMIWAEVSPNVKTVAVNYYPANKRNLSRTTRYLHELGKAFNPVKIELDNLELNTMYAYQLVVDGKPVKVDFPTQFKTAELWQHRKPAPDFSFLAGSCAYFNEPVFDRPGKPYGGDSSIFEAMAKTPAAFHIWMGDNWYTREVDFSSSWGLQYRASRDRGQKIIQPFMAAMPQYAIWDDHDYGPDNMGKNYIFKDISRDIFKNYTLNPSYGEDGKGIYCMFSYSDADIFLTDDRYFRSDDGMPDSIRQQPNREKIFFGKDQLDWLKNSLSFSKATFKIIVVGSQVLNPLNKVEGMMHYPAEYLELMGFLSQQKIEGVIFFTGDRHHSEVIRIDRVGNYPLFDVTISPYTAGISKVRGEEIANPYRIENTLVEKQNFGKISISGNKNERVLSVDFLGLHGERLAGWSIPESALKAVGK